MKLNLKVLTAAVALAMAGAAHADFTPTSSNNGTFGLVAFNQSTRAWYIRDLGYLMNSFLPSSVTTLSGDGSVMGDKTPASGLTLDKVSNPTTFQDASFGTWLTGQVQADVRWFVASYDNVGTTTATNVKRLIASSADPTQTVSNGQIDNYVGSGRAGGLGTFFGTGTLSKTDTTGASLEWDNNFGLGVAGLALLDQSANLFYFARSVGTGSTATAANGGAYSNGNLATVTLAANGDFTYALAPVAAVPLPAAAWMLGSGLLALGAARRRKSEPKA